MLVGPSLEMDSAVPMADVDAGGEGMSEAPPEALALQRVLEVARQCVAEGSVALTLQRRAQLADRQLLLAQHLQPGLQEAIPLRGLLVRLLVELLELAEKA